MRNSPGLSVLAAVTVLLLSIRAAPAEAVPPQLDHVIGGGYAAFESGGVSGENSYWVFARRNIDSDADTDTDPERSCSLQKVRESNRCFGGSSGPRAQGPGPGKVKNRLKASQNTMATP